jgi:hypothetical protein
MTATASVGQLQPMAQLHYPDRSASYGKVVLAEHIKEDGGIGIGPGDGDGIGNGDGKAHVIHPSTSTGKGSDSTTNAGDVEEDEDEDDDDDEIMRVTSQVSSRTRGRESDLFYADFLRSMK